jgi:hypothetical protein
MNKHLLIAERIATLLDNRFSFFGIKFGLAPLFDAIPVVGDFIAASLCFYLIWIAMQANAPQSLILKMVGNVIINFVIGLIPILGEATYIFRKVNIKNLELLKKHFAVSPLEGQIVREAY